MVQKGLKQQMEIVFDVIHQEKTNFRDLKSANSI